MRNHKFVYSTDPIESEEPSNEREECLLPKEQDIRIHLDRKGGRKIVSVIKGLSLNGNDFKQLAKELKSQCGVGGAVKDGYILIQGDHRNKLQEILKSKGYHVKLSGG
ncbi:MAG: translation initiation factor [Candidatus Marinimicrobia bacterium]|jgi:translation initiation factor 1|nr:translation initiation factor [Candidatus Neomarinimicrobiota bacterium]MBT3496653.1 translation initiation factor [Candidatus Neomarinimicrobiota bacterium]MBT3691723.1 translation initiation factor [Candidatus Neomarinimicrobiota bacterium]MBT3732201.1 translation initiation factor [Candidatus Neomarinimicrobiota bacterium]MBT4144641.1 translation initiation factor [Candidatus Neomarinimicrobiota bacterium]